MSRYQSRSRKRKFVGSAEMLEDRLVLNAGVPAPATPLPASSPFTVAQVRKAERALDRVDHGFMANSKHLKSFVINRTDYLQSVFARVAARAQVQVQHVSAEASASSSVGLANRAQALNNELNQIVGSFNTRVTQLSNGFEQQFGILAKPLAKLSLQLGVPANALENNFQLARAGLTSAVNSLTSTVQSQTSAATSQVSTASSSQSNATSTSATTGATSTSATNGIGITSTQTFSNGVTQAFSGLNTAINSVDATLGQAFTTFETQFANTVTSALSTFSNTPVATLQPTVSFVSGTGVTFTST